MLYGKCWGEAMKLRWVLLFFGTVLLLGPSSGRGAPPLRNVVLAWQQNGTVDAFRVYRGGHGGEVFLASVPGNTLTYTDPKVQPNKTFCYVVSSVKAGVESTTKSNEACVNT